MNGIGSATTRMMSPYTSGVSTGPKVRGASQSQAGSASLTARWADQASSTGVRGRGGAQSKAGSTGVMVARGLQDLSSEDLQARLAHNAAQYARAVELAEAVANGSDSFLNSGVEGSADGKKPKDAFDKYAHRVSNLETKLTKKDKGLLGLMYKLAEPKGEGSMQKVDELAKALVHKNFTEIMFNTMEEQVTGAQSLIDSLTWVKPSDGNSSKDNTVDGIAESIASNAVDGVLGHKTGKTVEKPKLNSVVVTSTMSSKHLQILARLAVENPEGKAGSTVNFKA